MNYGGKTDESGNPNIRITIRSIQEVGAIPDKMVDRNRCFTIARNIEQSHEWHSVCPKKEKAMAAIVFSCRYRSEIMAGRVI